MKVEIQSYEQQVGV